LREGGGGWGRPEGEPEGADCCFAASIDKMK
jgi:hypothetical protein